MVYADRVRGLNPQQRKAFDHMLKAPSRGEVRDAMAAARAAAEERRRTGRARIKPAWWDGDGHP